MSARKAHAERTRSARGAHDTRSTGCDPWSVRRGAQLLHGPWLDGTSHTTPSNVTPGKSLFKSLEYPSLEALTPPAWTPSRVGPMLGEKAGRMHRAVREP